MSETEEKVNMEDSDLTPHHFYVDDHQLFGNFHKDDTLSTPPKDFAWSEPCMMGIDEAGRGPVLGPMVYGSCIAPISKLQDLKSLGFSDSKVLNEEQRCRLFKIIKNCEYISWVVDPIQPQELSSKMLRLNKGNLNAISHDSAINFVRLFLSKGYNIQQLYVDTVGPAHVYQSMLQSLFPQIGTIVVASKADSTYPIVSAASICAKEVRDEKLRNWHYIESESGLDISTTTGSGYPGDPNTKSWLTNHIDPVFGFPDLVRFSWATSQKIIEEKCCSAIWGDENEQVTTSKSKQPKMGAFFSKTTSTNGQTAVDGKIDLKQRSMIHKRNHTNVTTTLPINL